MSFFKKIAKLISEESKVGKEDGQVIMSPSSNEGNDINSETISSKILHSQESPMSKDDTHEGETMNTPIETKEELRDVVCDLSRKMFDHLDMDVPHNLVIWLDTDQLTFQTYDTNQYRERMMEFLVNECDVRFDTVSFSIGKPAEELRCTPIGKSGKVFLQIRNSMPSVPLKPQKASISIFGNAGSLLKDEYTLSSDEMKEENISAYNIGAGEFPQIPSGYRHNHIAIDDNSQSPMIEKNKYVSRKHAHIGFSESIGFYLQVELDGTRLLGKRTRIFRGEQVIECDNPQVKIPLQNGDLLELGKAVVLKYVQLN